MEGDEGGTLSIERGDSIAAGLAQTAADYTAGYADSGLPDRAVRRRVRRQNSVRSGDGGSEQDGGESADTIEPIAVRHQADPAQENVTPPTKPRRNTKAAKQSAAKAVVTQGFNALNSGVSQFTSPAYAMKPYEREMMEEPLHAYAEQHPEAFIKTGEVIGPFTALLGLGLYLNRINRIYRAERGQTRRPTISAVQHTFVSPPPESQRVGEVVITQPDQPAPPPALVPTNGAVENGRSAFTDWAESYTKII